MATDAHVVSPLFFPGGDIGSLAVHGTINDVAVMGARPLYLAAAFILEEGFALADLARIVASMATAAREAGVPVVTGDTKVVERGATASSYHHRRYRPGAAGVEISGDRARRDKILVSGTLGDHGGHRVAAQGLKLKSLKSDCASLNGLVGGWCIGPAVSGSCAIPHVADWPPA
jgi:hydrogenase expression/formation protein HypE